jgi:hypothetical protein
MSDKQRILFDERVKEMVLIPRGMYEKLKEFDIDRGKTALVDTDLKESTETKKEQSGTKYGEYENVYKDSVQVGNLNHNVVDRSRGNIYDLLLKNKSEVISDLSPQIENKNNLNSVRWQKISQLLTKNQINKLIPVEKSSLNKTQFDVLFSKSKVFKNIFDKMHYDSDNSVVVDDKKDMDNYLRSSFSSKNQPTENDDQLPVVRTKEVEQNKPITENSMTSIKEQDSADNLTKQKKINF